MRTLVSATMLLLTAVSVAGADPSQNPIEPEAGTWKTWAIRPAATIPVPPPPDQAATVAEAAQLIALAARRDGARDQIAWWDTGTPSYRWNNIAVEEMLRANLPSNLAARHLALLHVAINDATVAVWTAKYHYHRKAPDAAHSATPSYPSEHASAAAASAAVLAYIFPAKADAFARLQDQAEQSRLLAGVNYSSDIAAGREIGRAVAVRVIEIAKADGSDVKWTGTVPAGAGKWNGTNPILPLGGTWKTWVLTSPDEFRPPPPAAFNSPERAAELTELKTFPRTPKTNADAMFWEYAVGGPRNYQYWNAHAGRLTLEYGLDAPSAARAYALESIAFYDAGVACWDGKYHYWMIRPFQLDPELKPLFNTPNHPSYPAAHGCFSTAAATMLGHLFPRDAAPLAALAEEAGQLRIWAGIHYRSDVAAGVAVGKAVAAKVIQVADSPTH